MGRQWSPLGLDPPIATALVVAVTVLLCKLLFPLLDLDLSWPLAALIWLGTIVRHLATVVQQVRSDRRRLLRYRPANVDDARVPDHVVYVPGLNSPLWVGPLYDWLWGRRSRDAPPLTFDCVPVPPRPSWLHVNLGTDTYLQAVVEALRRAPLGQRVALVGSSRGAAVVLQALPLLPVELATRLCAVVMLNGPPHTAAEVVGHRCGWLLSCVLPLYRRLTVEPDTIDVVAEQVPEVLRERLWFVTSAADTNLPSAHVKRAAQRTGGHLLVLDDAPHTLLLADYAEKKRVVDFLLTSV